MLRVVRICMDMHILYARQSRVNDPHFFCSTAILASAAGPPQTKGLWQSRLVVL